MKVLVLAACLLLMPIVANAGGELPAKRYYPIQPAQVCVQPQKVGFFTRAGNYVMNVGCDTGAFVYKGVDTVVGFGTLGYVDMDGQDRYQPGFWN